MIGIAIVSLTVPPVLAQTASKNALDVYNVAALDKGQNAVQVF
jgi:hypothetical protein